MLPRIVQQLDEGDGHGESMAAVESPQSQELSAHAPTQNCDNVDGTAGEAGADVPLAYDPGVGQCARLEVNWASIYLATVVAGDFNYRAARVPVPSEMDIDAWRRNLEGYEDMAIVDFLEYGWPAACDVGAGFIPTWHNHPTALNFEADVDYYVEVERGHSAIMGPFDGMPFTSMQVSPLMTRLKKDSTHRRVIMDLSWPPGASINDAIASNWYVDGRAEIRLPTADYMVGRLRELGQGAYLYKTDLARGYRQLRVDPGDWPLLGFTHRGQCYFDVCPPFGMRTSALFMQRTSEAICWVHGQRGHLSRPYLDDFGGAEGTEDGAAAALKKLQCVMAELGVREAVHKVCGPAQQMTWLGLWYDSVAMTVSIPATKLQEIMETLESWRGKTRATRLEMQRLLGLLQFVAGVSPPHTRLYQPDAPESP